MPPECVKDFISQLLLEKTLGGAEYESVFYFLFFCLFRAALAAYGGSQVRGPIGAVAAGLRHSHSNTGSGPRLQSSPQLTATPDP